MRRSFGVVLNLPVAPVKLPVRETVGQEFKLDGRRNPAQCHSWAELYLDRIPMMGNLVLSEYQGRGPIRPQLAR